MFKIGRFSFDKPRVLAPMAGFTDISFREFCYDLGADFAVSEMIMVKSLIYENQKGFELMSKSDKDNPFIIQLAGGDENDFVKALPYAIKFGADIIDINMGCPVPKVVNNGAGSALTKNPQKVYDIVKMVKDNSPVPITVKIRLGWDSSTLTYREVAKNIELAGADAITVHRRTRAQMYGNIYPLDVFKEIRDIVTIPIISNGNILTEEDIEQNFQMGVDGVMIGRGAIKYPWIFSKNTPNITHIDRYNALIKLLNLHLKYHQEQKGLNLMKGHYSAYIRDSEGAKNSKNLLMTATTTEDVLAIINSFFGINN
ncbi:tRNA-dihydrouridine synthase family protein [bacterium]|nr:tRNA-dihydrouridine synthase family protein [bacterium]